MPIPPWGSPPGGAAGQSPYTAIVAPSGGNYTTLSAALAAVAAGSTIYIMPGSYAETGGTYSLANLTIKGAGYGTVTLTLSANLVLSGTNLDFSGCTVVSNGHDLEFTGTYATIHDNYFKGSNADFIYHTGAYGHFTNNYVVATATAATFYGGSAYGVYDSNFFELGQSNFGGSLIIGQSHITFSNNICFRYNTSGSYNLISANNGATTITGNVFLGGNVGYIVDFSTSTNNVFSDNVCDQWGALVSGSGEGNVISGNSCNVSLSGNSSITDNTAIYNGGGSHWAIADNVIICSGTNGSGIYLIAGSDFTTVTGNKFYLTGVFAGTYGIYAAANRCIIANNTIENATDGISVITGGTNNIVTSNITNSCTTGISDSGTGTVNANNTT